MEHIKIYSEETKTEVDAVYKGEHFLTGFIYVKIESCPQLLIVNKKNIIKG